MTQPNQLTWSSNSFQTLDLQHPSRSPPSKVDVSQICIRAIYRFEIHKLRPLFMAWILIISTTKKTPWLCDYFHQTSIVALMQILLDDSLQIAFFGHLARVVSWVINNECSIDSLSSKAQHCQCQWWMVVGASKGCWWWLVGFIYFFFC